jgi:hypothetical protein
MDKIPEVTVTKGEVAVKLPKTYQDKGRTDAFEVELPDGQRIVIDPKRERKYYETTDDIFVGVGHNFMTIRTNKGVRTTEFSKADTFTISAETVKEAFDRYNAGYLFLVFPIIFVGQFMIYLISMVTVAVISFAITAFMREDYDFNARLRLSALALTPGITLSTLVMFLGHRTGPWFAPMVASLYIYVMLMLMRRTPPSHT